MNGIAQGFACQRRRQQREYKVISMFCDRRRQEFLKHWRYMLLKWRVCILLAKMKSVWQIWRRRHLLHIMLHSWRVWVHLTLVKFVWQTWRREANVRIGAMAALRRWREPRMVQARRRRHARVLLRRSLEEWWMYMLIHRAVRGRGDYPSRTYLEACLGRAIGDLATMSWWQ